MKIKLLQDAKLGANGVPAETASRRLVRERTMEVAAEHGRSAQDASKSDWDQAKRELMGTVDPDAKDAVLEAVPESERWDPLPGSSGYQPLVVLGDDEYDEGRSSAERLVEDGIAGAEEDHARQSDESAAEVEKDKP